jgi:hypothetical protein
VHRHRTQPQAAADLAAAVVVGMMAADGINQ